MTHHLRYSLHHTHTHTHAHSNTYIILEDWACNNTLYKPTQTVQYSTAGMFINQWMGVPGQSTAARLYGGISDEL